MNKGERQIVSFKNQNGDSAVVRQAYKRARENMGKNTMLFGFLFLDIIEE